MTGKQLLRGWLIMAAMLGLLTALVLSSCGCGTWRPHLYAGQGADMATTWYALDDGAREANPMADAPEDVLIMKAVVVGAVEFCAWKWPEKKELWYKIGAIAGYGAAAWNLADIMENN